MDKELRETVRQVAEYSNEDKARLKKRFHILFMVGVMGLVSFAVLSILDLDSVPPYDLIAGCGLGFASGMVVVGAIMTSKLEPKIRAFKMKLLGREL